MDLLTIAVPGTLTITMVFQPSDRIGVAPALVPLAGGTTADFLPFIPAIESDPQAVLEGILPPLLFFTAVSISTISFRRKLIPVAVLAILLVPPSVAVVDAVLTLLVPGFSLAWAIAMGAILDPTDAVAISTAHRLGVSQRITTVLEGEGLLDDAIALVVLSSAISAATPGGVSAGSALGGFALAILIAPGVGQPVGEASLRARSRITDPTVDTVVFFTVPLPTAIPIGHMHGSGSVATVVARLITGHHSPRMLPPTHQVASRTNQHTVELTLEGLIFLAIGLEFFGVAEKVGTSVLGIVRTIAVATVAGTLIVVTRALVVAPTLKLPGHRIVRWAIHWQKNGKAIHQFQNRCSTIVCGESEMPPIPWDRRPFAQVQRKLRQAASHESIARCACRLSSRVRRRSVDLDYFAAEPLGRREGAIIVQADMRGAITLVIAQTSLVTTPRYSFLLLVTMFVAASSLAIQELMLPTLVHVARPAMAGSADEEEKVAVISLLVDVACDVASVDAHDASRQAAPTVLIGAADLDALDAHMTMSASGLDKVSQTAPDLESNESSNPTTEQHDLVREQNRGIIVSPAAVTRAWVDPTRRHDKLTPMQECALNMIRAQRETLLDTGDKGLYSADSLEHTLDRLDYQEIVLTSDLHR